MACGLTSFSFGRELVREEDIPASLKLLAQEKRNELIATVADYDNEMADIFLNEEIPSAESLKVYLPLSRDIYFCVLISKL